VTELRRKDITRLDLRRVREQLGCLRHEGGGDLAGRNASKIPNVVGPSFRANQTVVALPFVAVLLFCQCGLTAPKQGKGTAFQSGSKCRTCGRQASLDGFTVSECDPARLLVAAVVDGEFPIVPQRRLNELALR